MLKCQMYKFTLLLILHTRTQAAHNESLYKDPSDVWKQLYLSRIQTNNEQVWKKKNWE